MATRLKRLLAMLALMASPLALAGSPVTGTASTGTAHASPRCQVVAVESIGVTVSDLERSVGFYTSVLGFEKVDEFESVGEVSERLVGIFGCRWRTARLRLGEELIDLTEFLTPRGRAMPSDSRANDRWFQHIAIVVSDMDAAFCRLREHGVAHASSSPQIIPAWNTAAAGIRAFYFRDPDGHFLECIWFPPGKGLERWQNGGQNLFLGIDHTAIVVGDTDAALRFYRDTLGLAVTGTSENHGPEQEHLSNVFGARLRITTLRSQTGPGVELLEYLTPGDGREALVDSRPNDLWHWQVRMRCATMPDAGTMARESRNSLISAEVVRLPERPNAATLALLIRDSDAHAVLLVR